jgi:hypothetical protein
MFHNDNRDNPDAKFLVYWCSDHRWCLGTGDRIKGMQTALKLAYHYKRILLLHWTHPAPLETFLQPATFDWIVNHTDTHGLYNGNDTKEFHFNQNRKSQQMLTGANISDIKRVVVATNYFDNENSLPGPDIGNRNGYISMCMYQAMFKPTTIVKKKVIEMKQRLFGDPGTPYIAIHLRLGGLAGERGPIIRGFNDTSSALVSVLRCTETTMKAWKAGNSGKYLTTPDRSSISSLSGYSGRSEHTGGYRSIDGEEGKALVAEAVEDDEGAVSDNASGRDTRQLKHAFHLLPTSWKGSEPSKWAVKAAKAILPMQLVVLTDYQVLRDAIASGNLPGIRGPSTNASHLNKAFSQNTPVDIEHHIDNFVDMGLLAGAACLITTNSGFGDSAHKWGMQNCWAVVVGDNKCEWMSSDGNTTIPIV